MSFWDKLTGQYVDVIEWLDNSNDTMVWRFDRYDNEIKYGAMLTVRETQVAVMVNEGEIADVFGPGMYELETANMPVLSTLQSWPYGFESPFKTEIYFFNTKRFTDLKWGTKNPIMLRDPEFGPIRLRAFGTYSMKVDDPVKFLTEIVGTDGHFTTDEVTDQLRNLIVSRFTSVLGKSNIAALDLAGNYELLSAFMTDKIGPDFGAYGLKLDRLLVENISMPKNVEEVLDRRTSVAVAGDLNDYAKFQAAEAMRLAAENPGGGTAGAGVGMGIGVAMAQQMGTMFSGQSGGNEAPPPLPATHRFYVAVDGAQTGPFGLEGLSGELTAGRLTGTSLVWSKGMANWQQASNVPALAELFEDDTPPPLPSM
jgi:membrane protease subunit (stomatin/prohibitin family)